MHDDCKLFEFTVLEIVRNRLKVESAISNARTMLDIKNEFGSFDSYMWAFVGGTPRGNGRKNPSEIPAETQDARLMSKTLYTRGFKFVGPTICDSFIQAVGMVNDHLVDCFRHSEVHRALEAGLPD